MANIDGQADHAAPALQTVGWSPKALFAAGAAIVVPVLLQLLVALVEMLAANPALFDGLPVPVQYAISVVVTGAGVLLAARKASPGDVR